MIRRPARVEPAPSESHWAALRWFAISRLVLAGAIWLASFGVTRQAWLEMNEPAAFRAIAFAYFALAGVFLVAIRPARPHFRAQLHLHAFTDLIALTLLVWAGGGVRGGFGVLVIATVAAAAVLATPRMAATIAATGALLLLGETGLRALGPEGNDPTSFMQAGLIGAACFVVGLSVNWLSTRLQAQEELARRRGDDLRNQLAVTQRVIAELQQGVLVVSADGRVRTMNRAAQTMLGAEFDARAPAMRGLQQVLARGWIGVAEAYARWVAQGARSVNEIDFSPEPAAGMGRESLPRVRLRFLSARDAADSDAVILIEDLNEVEQRAQQLKLASMGRLSASIAHEIRNPLGAIRHANSLLAEQLHAAPLQRLARIVEDNTVRINRTIEDVLSISRRERAVEEPIDMAVFLPAVARELQLQAGGDARRVGIAVRSDAPLSFDSNHLRQILANLVGNALRYASNLPAAVVLEWVETPAHRLELRVADDGPGLSPEALQHAFEPFYTTESRGTGLGLYLARELCNANGAALRYQRAAAGVRYSGAFVIEPRVVAIEE